MNCTNVLAIAIERRRIAIAAYSGVHLDYLQVRELSSLENDAGRTVQRFLTWALTTFKPTQIAIQAPPPTTRSRRLYLHAVARGTLLDAPASLLEVEQNKLRYLFTIPHVRTRGQARGVADLLFPEIARYPGQAAVREAALIGMHAQMTALFTDK